MDSRAEVWSETFSHRGSRKGDYQNRRVLVMAGLDWENAQ